MGRERRKSERAIIVKLKIEYQKVCKNLKCSDREEG
jgi:hypothetical protein